MAKRLVEVRFSSQTKDLLQGLGGIKIPDRFLHIYGQALVDEISKEAKKAARKTSIIPDTPDFYKSFRYTIVDSDVVITTTWPWIDPLIEGTDEFKMVWLTQDKGVLKVPMFQKDGSVVVRTAPLTVQDAWVHPAIAKTTFVQKGVEKAKQRLLNELAKEPSFFNVIKKLILTALRKVVF